ncbi:MAG: hypothetical protein U1E27_13835, partial [Kiritimatiellia bacterium]|nr:hypothetical protein [Kiritimatiellia bacterium]
MNDASQTLTLTGLIASVLAALFAVAAYSAQRRRKLTRETLHRKLNLPAPVGTQDSGQPVALGTSKPNRPLPRQGSDTESLFKIYSIGDT